MNYDNFIGPRKNWLDAGNRELIFLLLALVFGLFTANMVIFGGFALGFAIGSVLCTALSWAYLHRSGCRGNGYTAALLILSIIIAAGFGWSADSFVKTWLFFFLIAGINLAFCLMAGRNRFTPVAWWMPPRPGAWAWSGWAWRAVASPPPSAPAVS